MKYQYSSFIYAFSCIIFSSFIGCKSDIHEASKETAASENAEEEEIIEEIPIDPVPTKETTSPIVIEIPDVSEPVETEEPVVTEPGEPVPEEIPPPLPPPPPPPLIPLICGDGLLTPDEECDDGNQRSKDGCSDECRKEFCGDSIVNDGKENCDDGNQENGDGCDETCHTELIFAESNRSKLDVGFSQSCYKADRRWQLKCWGSNNQGELGQGNTEEIGNGVGESVKDSHPVRIGQSISTALVTTGGTGTSQFTCVVSSAGTLKCFGDNLYGQLGQGSMRDIGNQEDEMGNHLHPVSLSLENTVFDADTGGKHTCAILSDGQLKCFGDNTYGQLGLGDRENRGDAPGEMGINLPAVNLGIGRTASHISLGLEHSCAILDLNALKCWGRNDQGQLGQGSTLSIGDGGNEMGDYLPAINLGAGRTTLQVVAGAKHTCALLDDGSVKCFGGNNFGQLGQGNTTAVGDNPNEMGNNLSAINLGTGRFALEIAAGDYFTCALLDDRSVKCFGDNRSGQLGLGDTNNRGDNPGEMGDNLPAINLGPGRIAKVIAAGGSTTCVVLDNDELKCFGENGYGQLGLNDTNDRGDNPGEMGAQLPAVELGF